MVYDLGLMLASEGVLQSKRYLSSSETSTIKVHPHTTVDLLSKIEFSDRVKKAILHHHENWDGSGYPEGLKGNQIPVISRVLAVADAYFSMIEARPYRPEQSPQEALKEIRRETGSKFDPAVVASFVACLGKGT
jgi:HD-GYP domain-containing protein (c-di-GMP phosphodiesterase class II)